MNKRPPANRILLAFGALAFVIGLVLGKDQGDAETTSNTISAVLLTQGFLMVVALVDGTAHDRDRAFTRPIVHVFRVVEHQLVEFWDNPFDQFGEDEFWTTAGGTS